MTVLSESCWNGAGVSAVGVDAAATGWSGRTLWQHLAPRCGAVLVGGAGGSIMNKSREPIQW
jgi:hypothetical protein